MAAVIDAPSLLHLCLKVSAEDGCRARRAPGGASHFEGGWGSLMHPGKEREECCEEQHVISVKVKAASCSDVWPVVFFFLFPCCCFFVVCVFR